MDGQRRFARITVRTSVAVENLASLMLTRKVPDQGRSISRYASDAPEYRVLSAKMLAIMMCALTGTLFIYQGQEIGMINIPKDWSIDELRDIESVNFYKATAASTNNDKEALDYVMRSLQILGRDNARLPMRGFPSFSLFFCCPGGCEYRTPPRQERLRNVQLCGYQLIFATEWDSSAFAGFTDNKDGAWMRVHDLYPEINVASQIEDPESTYSFWKSMIRFRKEFKEVLVHGAFELFEPDNEQTFVFAKKHGNQMAVVCLNFTSEVQQVELPVDSLVFRVGNYPDSQGAEKDKTGRTAGLRPWEGRLYMLREEGEKVSRE